MSLIPEISYLNVKIGKHQVGRLAMGKQRLCAFEYDTEWLKNGFSISPFYLPLEPGLFTASREPFNGLFGVFSDSLPDGWGNLLIDRWLRENGTNPANISWIDRLSITGSSGMGALIYEPEVQRGFEAEQKSLDFYAEEVNKILHEEEVESLDHWIERAGSPGGARPKILMKQSADDTEWLIKFGAPNDPADIGVLEYTYSQAAQNAGIIMPETKLFEGRYFGTVRFDRIGDQRLHTITASGLLNASHRYPSLDYTDLMKATLHLTRSIVEVKKIYRQMIFNVLTKNRDDHAKNFSFLYQDGEWKCTPAYDLVYSIGFNGKHSTTINGKGSPQEKDMLDSGEKAGLSRKVCREILEEVKTATTEISAMIDERFR